ncbi:MAG: aminotransferase class I/II-fold pyridoxal phosphate-dependent enzyme [bacterium]
MQTSPQRRDRIQIRLASNQDREIIYKMRHTVFAEELAQHPQNKEKKLSDPLDTFNSYIVATSNGRIAGFISITPPGRAKYSVDKYLQRDELPLLLNDKLYEVRLLAVHPRNRRRKIASLLMYAAFRWVEAHGGRWVVALGRQEIIHLYLKAGLQLLGRQIEAGAVTYELMSAKVSRIRERMAAMPEMFRRLDLEVEWQLGIPFYQASSCVHGGTSFDLLDNGFSDLNGKKDMIHADVLDAWYPPSPKVLEAMREHLAWMAHTSPPIFAAGLIKTIARVRGVETECVLPGAGASNLIYLALRQWLTPSSKVLVLDPTYGEYRHVLERIIGCRVERFVLPRTENYCLDCALLKSKLGFDYDLVILVNPNNPTGRHVPRAELIAAIDQAPESTRFWIDETYIEYAGTDQSLERFAAKKNNVVVCKSMSKVYALSGLRVAYLCAAPEIIEGLKPFSPPWGVSLPAQIAAVRALQYPAYYAQRYQETHVLRKQLVERLQAIEGMEIVPSVTNYLLCHLPPQGPKAATVCDMCQSRGLFVRDVSDMGTELDEHAIRIAVKDALTNDKMIQLIEQVLKIKAEHV